MYRAADIPASQVIFTMPDEFIKETNIQTITLDLNSHEAFTLESFKDLVDNGTKNFIIAFTQDPKTKIWFEHVFDAKQFETFIDTHHSSFKFLFDPVNRLGIKALVPVSIKKENGQYLSYPPSIRVTSIAGILRIVDIP